MATHLAVDRLLRAPNCRHGLSHLGVGHGKPDIPRVFVVLLVKVRVIVLGLAAGVGLRRPACVGLLTRAVFNRPVDLECLARVGHCASAIADGVWFPAKVAAPLVDAIVRVTSVPAASAPAVSALAPRRLVVLVDDLEVVESRAFLGRSFAKPPFIGINKN